MLEVLRSGRLSLGPQLREFERRFAARVGAPFASAVSSGTAGLHLALRAVGVEQGDEVLTSPFSFVASANAVLYENAKPVFADIDPVTLNLDPGAAGVGGDRADASDPARAHLRIPGRDERLRVARAATRAGDRRGRLRGARRSSTATARRSAGAGIRRCSASTRTSRSRPARAAWCTLGDRALKERIDSERNQGRAKDMGWLDHDRLGFNYRLSDIACALGIAQLRRLEEMLAARARVAGWYRELLGGIDELLLPCEDRDGDRRSWFVFVVQLPARRRPRRGRAAPGGKAAFRASRICRRST